MSPRSQSGPDAVEILAQEEDQEEELLEEEPEERLERPFAEGDRQSPRQSLNPRQLRVSALVRKLRVNTGHASVEQMLRLPIVAKPIRI